MPTLEALRERLPAINAWLQSEIDAGHTPGAAVGIVAHGEIIFAGGFGLRDMERRLPVDADTIFAIGSCSKAFTALGAGLLVDEGKLTWDTPIRDLLPEFRLHDPIATELSTVRDLLSHQTGLPRHDFMWYGSTFSREDLIARLRHLKPSATFRQRWQYQNMMYMTAGYIVGKVAGTTWEDFTQTHIFDPLDMKRSQFSVRQSEADANAALPYAFRQGAFKAIPFRDISTAGPAGSINSNVDDMLKWVRVHLTHKPGLVKDETLRELHTPQVVIPETPDLPWYGTSDISHMSYTLGWASVSYRGHSTLRHAGGIDGFNASVGLLPHENVGIVVLCNALDRDPASVIMYGIMDRLLGLEPLAWWDRFAANRERMEAAGAEQKKALMDARKADTPPSHPLADYAGVYRHPGYGDFTVSVEGDKLSARYNGLPLRMTPHHYEIFQIEDEDNELTLLASFVTDAQGKVARFSCRLEPSVDAIEFARVEASG